jgi:hypothetical protein
MILAGFLGAGKTTMLNHILSAKHGCKIGVLVNDFGSINVDAELISEIDKGLDGAGIMMTLANGCACCGIRTDLMQAVLKMATKTNPPEHIVIEASGVADPKGVYDSFLEREIRNLVLVDGVITVIDAELVLELEDSEAKLARTQVEGCDLGRYGHFVESRRLDSQHQIGTNLPYYLRQSTDRGYARGLTSERLCSHRRFVLKKCDWSSSSSRCVSL